MKCNSQKTKSRKRRVFEIATILLVCFLSMLVLSGCACGGISLGFKICKHCMIV